MQTEMEMKDYPLDFRCPISMELMTDPVTICTGVTYERKNIEKWFFIYKKKTCPATMQSINTLDITPNHTLNRLIQAWINKQQSPPTSSIHHHDFISLLSTLHSTPFKVTSLKKLRSILQTGDHTKAEFIRSGGVQIVVQILVQILVENSDFVAFRASEEALGVLHQLPLPEVEHEKVLEILTNRESLMSMVIILQSGSAEARLYAITIFQKIAKTDFNWNSMIEDQGIDFFKSLLELVSDEICSKASSCALDVLIEILSSSKKSRLRAIEVGAVSVLIELLPESSGSKCEKVMVLIKLMCESAEGRMCFVGHKMGIPAVSKKLLHVSNTTTKMGVKILWLISSFQQSERVLEEMLIYGSVKKLVALLHMEGRSSTKEKVIKMLKLHANSWRRYPCFPCDLKEYLGLLLSS
ncbi:E3 ubiquitin-protein ligase PUB23-like [Pistacia vera]|uniref:E3 ubiquitin-protein ligase PUB23-like n=1 Tax=Pistacia vera TaxID=55513 RepID=UPI001263AED6|nr:E3 ubiquitin-protein ligase PUB23-like [Pistacia vera]